MCQPTNAQRRIAVGSSISAAAPPLADHAADQPARQPRETCWKLGLLELCAEATMAFSLLCPSSCARELAVLAAAPESGSAQARTKKETMLPTVIATARLPPLLVVAPPP